MTSSLVNRCKQEGTTVHAALCAAMLFGVAKIVRADTPMHFSCTSTVSLRKYCEPEVPEDYMSCIADGVGQTFTVHRNTSFWDLAREAKSRINHSIDNGLFYMDLIKNLMGNEKPNQKQKPNQSKRPKQEWEPPMGRVNTIKIANAGRLKISGQHGNFELKEIYFLDRVHVIGPCFGLTVVTLNDQIFCTFPYVTPLISDQTAETFVNYVMNTLQIACMPQSLNITWSDEVEKELVSSGSKS